MNLKIKKICATAFTIIIVAFLVIGFLMNKKLVASELKKSRDENLKLKDFIENTQAAYKTDFKGKTFFINLNGLFERLAGAKQLNNATKLKNGMLTYGTIPKIDMTDKSNVIADLNNSLKAHNIDYLYVQAPLKADINNEIVYKGTVNYGNENADQLLYLLDEKNVYHIDLRQSLAANVEMIERNFFKTDHHWKTSAAFNAFGILLGELNEKYPDAGIDMTLADIDNWNAEVYEKCFLGSHGKRVGTMYAGIDDYELYTPKFDTEMSMYIPKYKTYYSGNFADTVVTGKKYLENNDYFNENPYCAYIGGDYPIVHHRNANAKSDLKVLMIKDSFMLPLQAFMSTAFKEVDVVDPRHFKECSVAEYIEISKPDIVIEMLNPSVFDDKAYYNFGISQGNYHYNQTTEKVVFNRSELNIEAPKTHMYCYNVLKSKASYNTKYKISFEDVEFLSGESEYITVALYNATTKQFVSSFALDIDCCREKGEFEWTCLTPDNGNDNLQILIYAGGHSHTGRNNVRFINLKVIEYS